MNIVYKGNNSAFSFLQLIFEKINKNTNIKSQNIKTSIKNYYTSNFIKVFNNSSKSLAKSSKSMKLKTH